MNGSKVLILGITFKENCPDVRNTKAVDLITALNDYGTNITIHDPWADEDEVMYEYGLVSDGELNTPYFGRESIIQKTGIKYRVTKFYPDEVIARDGEISSGKKVGCWIYKNYAGQKMYEIDYFDTILKINDSIKFLS